MLWKQWFWERMSYEPNAHRYAEGQIVKRVRFMSALVLPGEGIPSQRAMLFCTRETQEPRHSWDNSANELTVAIRNCCRPHSCTQTKSKNGIFRLRQALAAGEVQIPDRQSKIYQATLLLGMFTRTPQFDCKSKMLQPAKVRVYEHIRVFMASASTTQTNEPL